jgi:hypothetical protein
MLCAAPALASRSHHVWPVSQPRASGISPEHCLA